MPIKNFLRYPPVWLYRVSHLVPNLALKILQRNLNRSAFVVWEMKRNVSVVRLIVATRSSGPPASGNIIKEMPGSVVSGTPYICHYLYHVQLPMTVLYNSVRYSWRHYSAPTQEHKTHCHCLLNRSHTESSTEITASCRYETCRSNCENDMQNYFSFLQDKQKVGFSAGMMMSLVEIQTC